MDLAARKIINRFQDGTIIIGSVKGITCPKEINEKIGFLLNGFKVSQVEPEKELIK